MHQDRQTTLKGSAFKEFVLFIVIGLLIWWLFVFDKYLDVSAEMETIIRGIVFVLIGALLLPTVSVLVQTGRKNWLVGLSIPIVIAAVVALILVMPFLSPTTIYIVGNTYGGLQDDVKEFCRRNRDIRVEVVDQYKMDTNQRYEQSKSLLENTTLDVFEVDGIWVGNLAESRQIRPLNEFYKKDESQFAFYTQALKSVEDGKTGNLYAVPLYLNVGMIFHRKKYIPEGASMTLSEFTQRLKDLKRNQGAEGIIFQSAQYEGLVCLFWEIFWNFASTTTGDLTPGGEKIKVNGEAGKKALEMMHNCLHRWKIAPMNVLRYKEEESKEAFLKNERIVAHRNWPRVLRKFLDPDKIGVLNLEGAKGVLGGWNLAISSKSKHPKEAWRLIKFLCGKKMCKKRLYAKDVDWQRIPPHTDVVQAATDVPFIEDIHRAILNSRHRPFHRNYMALSKILSKGIFKVLMDPRADQRTIQMVLDNMQIEIDGI